MHGCIQNHSNYNQIQHIYNCVNLRNLEREAENETEKGDLKDCKIFIVSLSEQE